MNKCDPEKFLTKHVSKAIAVIVAIAVLWIAPQARAAFSVLHTFKGSADGAMPSASLTPSGSTLNGTTADMGVNEGGTIFKIKTDGTGYQVLHSFASRDDGGYPFSSFTLSGSALYGTTGGGPHGHGTIFKIKTDGTGYRVLHTFTGGADGAGP